MNNWTKEELDILANSSNKSLEDLCVMFPEKTQRQIIKALSNYYASLISDRWSPQEDEIIVKNASKTVLDIMLLLPKRTYSSIITRRATLGVQRKWEQPFTSSELKAIANLKRSGFSLTNIAIRMGVAPTKLQHLFYSASISKEYTEFRSKNADLFTRRLKPYKKWTENDNKALINSVKTQVAVEDLATHYNVTTQQVQNKLRALSIPHSVIINNIRKANNYTQTDKYKNAYKNWLKSLTNKQIHGKIIM